MLEDEQIDVEGKDSIYLQPVIPVSDKRPSQKEEEELLQYLKCGCTNSDDNVFSCNSNHIPKDRVKCCQEGMKTLFSWYFGRLHIHATSLSRGSDSRSKDEAADCLMNFCKKVCDPNPEHCYKYPNPENRHEHVAYIYPHLKQNLRNNLREPILHGKPIRHVDLDPSEIDSFDNNELWKRRYEFLSQLITEESAADIRKLIDSMVDNSNVRNKVIMKQALRDCVEEDDEITQRDLASRHGVALGTINNWIKQLKHFIEHQQNF